MKNLRNICCFWPLAALACVLLLAPLPSSAETKRRITRNADLSHSSGQVGRYEALIIGINEYTDKSIPALDAAVKDAEAVARILKERYGFKKITLLKNQEATKGAMDRAFREMIKSLGADDSLLVYFAGHGEMDRLTGSGWWVPADARAGDTTTYFDNTIVQNYLRAMSTRHVLLVSDSCYSGTLFGETRALPPTIDDKFYLDLFNERSRWGMTSGNKTPVADKGLGGHSIFAYQLVRALEKNSKPYLTPREIYAEIGPIVRNNSEQMPICRPINMTGDQGGEFVFILNISVSVAPALGRTEIEAERKKLEEERARLEREKQEVASRKAQEEERLRLEVEKKRIEEERRKLEEERAKLASVPPKPQQAPGPANEQEVGRDGVYIAYANGIVKDTKTGLEWVAGPDKNMSWKEATAWVKSLNLGGGGWRMPTPGELKGLYQYGKGSQNMTPLLKTTGHYVWSGQRSASVIVFDYSSGDDFVFGVDWGRRRFDSYLYRAFAVRSRSSG